MLDLETIGNGADAAIVQVGAVYFNRHTGALGNQFKINIELKTALDSGAKVDADTIYWWLNQSSEARFSITNGPRENIFSAMVLLVNFLVKADYIWSHATFDFTILSQTLRRLEINPTFKFRSTRDIRTLLDLADGVSAGAYNKNIKREGVHHDALDDCKHQVKYCVKAFNTIYGTGKTK